MDIEHFYRERGHGFPLILLHGNGENSGYFEGQMEALSGAYHVYAIDTRGHGQTPRGERPFTIRQFAEDLLGFMDAHQIERAHLLGFSDGGNIAMVFAMNHPERVERLILNGANLDAGGVKRKVQIPIEIGYRVARWFAGWSESARRHAEMLGLMVNEPHIEPSELARLTMPVLVVAGTKDMIKESHTRLIYKSLPNAKLEFIEGDHFVANKCPELFNETVKRFLGCVYEEK